MSAKSISSSTSALQTMQTKPQASAQNQASRLMPQPKVEQPTVAEKNAATKLPQAGGNGVPPKPVSTSTKTVQHLHRINVQA